MDDDDVDRADQRRTAFSLVADFLSGDRLSFWEVLAAVAFMVGTATVLVYTWNGEPKWPERFGLLFAVAGGAWTGGGLLGFLFGVPKYKSEQAQPTPPTGVTIAEEAVAFTPNTNLEQISDWLTKIIIGATLVQIGAIVRSIGELCVWIGAQVGKPSAAIFAGGILALFFFSGFMWGYLWSSIRIFREMVRLTAKMQAGGK